MPHPLATPISRRESLIGLAGAFFAGGMYRAEAQEARKERTPYGAPELQIDLNLAHLRSKPPCKALRFSQGVPSTCCSKVFVKPDGSLHLQTLPFLDRSGWMRRWRASTLINKPTISNPTYSDPDIHPSHGSGVLLTLNTAGAHRELYLSNEHVFRGAAWQIEDKAVYDWHYDLGVMRVRELSRHAEDRTPLPQGQIARSSVRNGNLCSRTLEVVGFGSDLFKFVGQPFQVPTYITHSYPFQESPRTQHLLFGLRIPRGFLRDIAEIGGMSGSPVVLEGTSEVVGVVSRVLQIKDGNDQIPFLLFTGPDQVRGLLSRAEGTLGP